MLDNVLPRGDLLGFMRQQARDSDQQSVPHERVEEFLAKGWRVLRKSRKSTRLAREKSVADALESRAWMSLYKMGFPLVSGPRGAQLLVTSEDAGGRDQLDIVAIDSEVAVCAECKSLEQPGTDGTFAEKLAKHTAHRDAFRKAVAKCFPADTKRHVAMLMFTRNIELRDGDRARADEQNIVLMDEQDLNYYEELVRILGPAARYQFLAEVCRGRKIPGLKITVPALRAKMGGHTCYSFATRPEYLLKTSYVAHRSKAKAVDVDAYQRMISPQRRREIAEYISQGGLFPTNIVINIKDKNHVLFQRGEQVGDEEGALFGWLTMSPAYGCAWIIDGQHRLYAYSGHEKADTSYMSVLAFEGLSETTQAQLFVDVNSKQKRVKSSLLIELASTLKWQSPDEDERLSAVISRACLALDQDPDSPLHERVLLADVKSNQIRCVTITALKGALDKPGLYIVQRRRDVTEYGPLWRDDADLALARTVCIVNGWFGPISSTASDWWALGKGDGGGLSMNNGVTVGINVLNSVLAHLGRTSKPAMLDDDELVAVLEPYSQALGSYFASFGRDQRAQFRRLQGVNGQTTGTRECEEHLRARFPEFNPPGLDKWIAERDAHTNDAAKKIVEEIELILQKTILTILKSEHPIQDEWWWAVPRTVRVRVDAQINESDGHAGKREQNFNLIDYRHIVVNNWDSMGRVFGYRKDGNSKEKQTRWMEQVNKMRNIVDHPSRREFLPREDLAKLEEYRDWLAASIAESRRAADASTGGTYTEG